MIILRTKLYLYDSGTYAYFKDLTGATTDEGYGRGGNIDYADVKAVRIYIANYSTLNNLSPPADGEFQQYFQYLKVAGSAEVIDGKVFSVGAYFVPQSAGITTAEASNWQTTGYYIYPFLNTWLPTSAEVPLQILTEQFGQTGTNIEDNEYLYGYEIYNNEHVANFTSTNGQSYMVLSGTAVYSGDTYNAGEVFTASDASTVTVSSSVVELYGATSAYAALTYQVDSDLNDLIEQEIGKNNQDLTEPVQGAIMKIRMKKEALDYSSKTNNVSLLYAYQTIQDMQDKLTELLNPAA